MKTRVNPQSEYPTANAAFQDLYTLIMDVGKIKGNTRYIRNVSFSLVSPWLRDINTEWRKWNKDYAELEWEWYLTGNRNPEMVEKKAKLWEKMKDDAGFVNSNYGYWWKLNHQLQRVISGLNMDPESRRAIIVHYDPNKVHEYGKDTPCNVVLNFYIEYGSICMTIFARSVDLVYGFCNDQFCFSKLLEMVSETLGIPQGHLHYFITDLHIYDRHFDMINKFYNNPKLNF